MQTDWVTVLTSVHIGCIVVHVKRVQWLLTADKRWTLTGGDWRLNIDYQLLAVGCWQMATGGELQPIQHEEAPVIAEWRVGTTLVAKHDGELPLTGSLINPYAWDVGEIVAIVARLVATGYYINLREVRTWEH